MKYALLSSLVIVHLAACTPSANDELPAFEQEAKTTIAEFAGQLKSALQTAMQSGGPEAAVNVCQVEAPKIAEALAAKTGFDIGRTSLKVRNPANQAKSWQQIVLNDFESQKQSGTPVNELQFVAVSDDSESLRFMKAINTETVCLTCHGQNLSSALQTEINRLYPEDQATGFKQNDIRGAFSVVKYRDE